MAASFVVITNSSCAPELSDIVFISKSCIVFERYASNSDAGLWVWIVMDVPPVRDTSLLIMSSFWM